MRPPLSPWLHLLGYLTLALLLTRPSAGAESPSNWANDPELDGIVDLLDPDYLKQPINVQRLPLKHAVKTVIGKGERIVYTFEDPNCGYCRQLTRHLHEIGNVTVYTYIVTFLGESSVTKADAVWCAPDRPKAWHAVMKNESVPSAPAGCQAPRAATMNLVGMLGINLTPTVFYADGSRMSGVRPKAEIETRLAQAAKRP